jgi:hypothetical protein
MPAQSGTDLLDSLRRLRWAAVGLLAVCAVYSWLQARDASQLSPGLASSATPVAIALAVVIIVSRQVALRAGSLRVRFTALLATYVACCALGLFGALLAFAGDDGTRGALFALGGAIFTLGSPPGFGRLETKTTL